MKQFSYYDYLEYKKLKAMESLHQNGILQVKEDGEEYQYTKEKVNHPHDKLFRLALDSKRQVSELINRELKLKSKECITEEKIEKYNSSFINEKFENQESDVVYKKKD